MFEELEENGDDLVRLLQQAYLNERSAPEMLPYNESLVKNLLDILEYQNSTYLEVAPGAERASHMVSTLVELECERIKYLLRSYIEIRLEKANMLYPVLTVFIN